MNSKDAAIQTLLQGMIKGASLLRIDPIEQVLKDEGFLVPPRPSSKLNQGEPRKNQAVKLSDDEVIRDLLTWIQDLLNHGAKAIAVASKDSVRKIFTDILFSDMTAFEAVISLGKSRFVLTPPPPATGKKDSLNMDEVASLWDIMILRHLSLQHLDVYVNHTEDPELIALIKNGLNKVVLPQIENLENRLKKEGFVVPSRPITRLIQGSLGKIDKVVLSDSEIVAVLMSASQLFLARFVRAYVVSLHNDIRDLFKEIVSMEIKWYQKTFAIAASRNILVDIPTVSAKPF